MTEIKSADFYAGVLSPFLLILLVVPLVLLKAWVLTYLWKWYVVPMFGLPPLRLVFAFGLSLTANYLLPSHTENGKQNGATLLVQLVISPFVALALGWIGTWFI